MAQTFNRRPYLQDGPKKSDVKNHTFDNYKFTGFKEDKNFLEIDQYSFEECNNIYVDNDGLLRSRPSIKSTTLFTNAIRVLRQNDVYIAQYNNFYTIYHDNNSINVNGIVYAATSYGSKIYIFSNDDSENKIICYNKDDNTIVTSNLIYIPETEVQANSDTTKAEPKNALTEKTKTIYFYLSSGYSQFLSNRTVTYTAFGMDFEFTFDDFTKNTLLEEVVITDSNSIYAWYRNGGTLVCFDSSPQIGVLFNLRGIYSYDDKSYNSLPTISGIFRGFAIASDGVHLLLAMDDNIYICDLNNVAAGWTSLYIMNDRISSSVSLSGDSDVDFHFFYRISNLTSNPNHKLCGYYNGSTYSTTITINNVESFDEIVTLKTYPVYWDNDLPSTVYGLVLIGVKGRLYFKNNNECTIYVSQYVRSNIPNVYAMSISQIAVTRLLDFNYSGSETLNFLYSKDNGTSITFHSFDISTGSQKRYKSVTNMQFTNGNIFADGMMAQVGTKLWDLNNRFIEFTVPIDFYNVFYVENTLYAVIQNPETSEYVVVTNNIQSPVRLTELKDGDNTIITPEQIEQLNEYYFRVGNKLYISEYREDNEGNLQWYLPEINIEEFDGFVTMCPLSSTEMGIFTETGVYVVYRSEQQRETSTGWKYYPYIQIKSKIDVKIRQGSDVLPTYDGTSLIVPTTRGLALMTYQDFVQSTDQKLEFLSDTIYDAFDKYNTSGIKLFRYSYWFFVYKTDDDTLFLLDIRNGSWWPMSGNKSLKSFILYNDKPLLLTEDEKTYIFDKSVDNYKDDDGFIDWYLKSQKLYLGAANYYKHIQNLTFMSHLLGDNDDGYSFKCYLRNTAYRSRISSDAEGKMWEYDIEMIRSYVLRLNYPKVCEFQYELRMNKENTTVDFTPVPLSLSNITVKYRMGGQIR